MRSIIRANPPARVAAAFLVGGLAVLVVHQPVVGPVSYTHLTLPTN